MNEVDESNLKRAEYDEFRLISADSTPSPPSLKAILISFEHDNDLFTG